ncbi:vWA domain-containing protein [Ureibacillus sp. FSL K6-2830]|uniref:vWA domain-containing protein n=1 Tax=Ureibacillus sp. FSL K6-2830 TaxID=2954610 RepID=UPI0030F9E340
MKKLINILLVLFLTFIPYYSNVRAENNFNYETSYMLVIDASGSMASNTRIERAKSAAQSFINSVKGKNVEVGLIAFYNCGDVRVIHELTSDVEKLIDPLNSIQPSGTTPLVGAISFSADYLKQHGTGQKGKLIVYTDGADTCGGNYQDARNALEGLEIDIWGIDLPEYVEKELEENLNVPVQDLPEDEPGELVRIFVEPYPSDFSVGQTIQTVVKAEWSNGKITTLNPLEVSYKSSREDRVIVSTDGKLTALNRGTSFIDYEYQGKTFRNIVNVNPAPVLEDFYLETALPSTMEIGDKYTVTGLKAKWSNGTVTDVSINDVLITSSREDRIKVKNGELEALDSGTSYIDFTFNGKKFVT